MKTAVLTMVRNEIDILPVWVPHALAMFDAVLVVDHGSDDGSYEYLEEMSECERRLRLFRFNHSEFPKEYLIDYLKSLAAQDDEVEWFFQLDPDEFLPYENAGGFKAALAKTTEKVLLFRWRNCYPAQPGTISLNFEGFQQVRQSKIGKLALHRTVATDPRYFLQKGAHSLLKDGQPVPLPAEAFGQLYHIPIRSLEQAWEKLLKGCRSRAEARARNPASPMHWHYPVMLRQLADRPRWESVANIVYDYGMERRFNMDRVGLSGRFQSCSLWLAGNDDSVGTIDACGADSLSLTDIANREPYFSLLQRIKELDSSGEMFEVYGGNEIRYRLDYAGERFAALPPEEQRPAEVSDLLDALTSAYWPIENEAPSAWRQHIPFLFSLIHLVRPRRYVELGVHNGASFLAACQAIKRLGLESSCVAIDSWQGDPHAGQYQEDAFAKFRSNLAEYSDFAGYIRGFFDEAADNFEDRSIDVIHIDGLHTQEAVRRDFETWLPKMSSRGIMMFHDINEFTDDFGVWRFWREVQDTYPSMEFGHAHGLGILVVGGESAVSKLLDKTSPGYLPTLVAASQIIYGNIPTSDPEWQKEGLKAHLTALRSSASSTFAALLRAIKSRLVK